MHHTTVYPPSSWNCLLYPSSLDRSAIPPNQGHHRCPSIATRCASPVVGCTYPAACQVWCTYPAAGHAPLAPNHPLVHPRSNIRRGSSPSSAFSQCHTTARPVETYRWTESGHRADPRQMSVIEQAEAMASRQNGAGPRWRWHNIALPYGEGWRLLLSPKLLSGVEVGRLILLRPVWRVHVQRRRHTSLPHLATTPRPRPPAPSPFFLRPPHPLPSFWGSGLVMSPSYLPSDHLLWVLHLRATLCAGPCGGGSEKDENWGGVRRRSERRGWRMEGFWRGDNAYQSKCGLRLHCRWAGGVRALRGGCPGSRKAFDLLPVCEKKDTRAGLQTNTWPSWMAYNVQTIGSDVCVRFKARKCSHRRWITFSPWVFCSE